MTGGGHAPGTGRRGATEFPASWTREQIVERFLHVARFPDETPTRLPSGVWRTVGVRAGVRIVVLLDPDGGVRAAFPVEGPGVVRNPDRAPDPARPTVDDLVAGRPGYAADELLAGLALDGPLGTVCAELARAGEWAELAAVLRTVPGADDDLLALLAPG